MRDSGENSRLNRRELIVKSLQVGGAAYVAPMILASATPAMAQITNPLCVGATCETFIECSTNPDCVCVTLSSGGGLCIPGSTLCASLTACGEGNTCPAGSLCAVNTCCVTPVCIPTALTEACAGGQAAGPRTKVPGSIGGK